MSRAELGRDLRRVAADLRGLLLIHAPALSPEAIGGLGLEARLSVELAAKSLEETADVLAPGLDDLLAPGSRVLLEEHGGLWTASAEGGDGLAFCGTARSPGGALELLRCSLADLRRVAEHAATEEPALGRARVVRVFRSSTKGDVAGCAVDRGEIRVGDLCRVIRDGADAGSVRVGQLRRFYRVRRAHATGLVALVTCQDCLRRVGHGLRADLRAAEEALRSARARRALSGKPRELIECALNDVRALLARDLGS